MGDPKKPDNIVQKVFNKPQGPEKVSALFTHQKQMPKVAPEKKSDKLSSGRRLPAVLDFGTSGVKLVQLLIDSKGELEVILMDDENYPSGSREGQVQKKQALEKLLTRHKLTTEVVIGIPSKEIQSLNLAFPPMAQAELKEAVHWKLKQIRPLDAETDKLRTALVPWMSSLGAQTQNSSQQRVTVICALADSVDEKTGLAYAFGLKTQSVYSSAAQIVNLSKFRQAKSTAEEVILWLDLGAEETMLLVDKKGDICFSRALSVSSAQLTRQLAQAMKLSDSEAENLKRRHGLEFWAPGREISTLTEEERKSPAGQVFLSLLSTLENLIVDLEHSFKHFSYQVTQSQIQRFDRVVLVGGGANLRNLDRFIGDRLGVPVERLDALASMRVNATVRSSRKDFPNDSAVFAPALGVSLSAVNEKSKGLNFLTTEKRKVASQAPRSFSLPSFGPLQWAVAALVVAALWIAPQWFQLRQLKAQATSLSNQVKSAREQLTLVQGKQLELAQKEKDLTENNELLEEKVRQFRQAGREKKAFSSILARLSEVLPADVWITQLNYSERRLTIVGGTTKTEIVAGVIDSLKKPDDFSDVTFHYTQRDETTSTYRFEITMNVR